MGLRQRQSSRDDSLEPIPISDSAVERQRPWLWIPAAVVIVATGAAVVSMDGAVGNGGSPSSRSHDQSSTSGAAANRSEAVVPLTLMGGTIASIDGRWLALAVPTGVLDVRTTSETSVTFARTGSLRGIDVGDRVDVTTSGSPDVRLDALRVVDYGTEASGGNGRTAATGGLSQSMDASAPLVSGPVVAVDDTKLAVRQLEGSVAVLHVTPSTEILVPWTTDVAALRAGDGIFVAGHRRGGRVDAVSITVSESAQGTEPDNSFSLTAFSHRGAKRPIALHRNRLSVRRFVLTAAG